MRIGILAGNISAKAGGSYTFENDLLETLLNYKSTCKHKFVIFSWDKEWETRVRNINHAEFVLLLLGSKKERILKKTQKIANDIAKRIRHPFNVIAPKESRTSFMDKILIAHKIDITWALNESYVSLKMPYVTSLWDLQHRLQPQFPEVSIDGLWENREIRYSKLLRRASLIITGTNEGKSEIEKFYQVPQERIKVLPMPTPQFALTNSLSEETCQSVIQKYGLPANYLFYPAQFWPHKNHVGLLLAVKHLKDHFGISIPVVFTGADKGNLSYVKEKIMDIGLEKQVHILGFVERNELVALYKKAFALTFTSYFGPDNIPPLEAFALGCPVIASNAPGAEEQLGKAALLVDPKDPEDIASGIKKMIDNNELRETMTKNGLVRALEWTGTEYINAIMPYFDDISKYRVCWK